MFVVLVFWTTTVFLSLHVYRMTPGKLPQLAVWATLLLGFPLMILVDRANIEGVIWVLILLGIGDVHTEPITSFRNHLGHCSVDEDIS